MRKAVGEMHYRWWIICILEKKAHCKNSSVVGERKYEWIHALSVCGGMAKRKEWNHGRFLLGRVDRTGTSGTGDAVTECGWNMDSSPG